MTPEERKELEDYYGAMLSMCASEGWKYLMEDFESSMLVNLDNIRNAEDLWFEKGKRRAAQNLMNLEDSIRAAREALDVDNS